MFYSEIYLGKYNKRTWQAHYGVLFPVVVLLWSSFTSKKIKHNCSLKLHTGICICWKTWSLRAISNWNFVLHVIFHCLMNSSKQRQLPPGQNNYRRLVKDRRFFCWESEARSAAVTLSLSKSLGGHRTYFGRLNMTARK